MAHQIKGCLEKHGVDVEFNEFTYPECMYFTISCYKILSFYLIGDDV